MQGIVKDTTKSNEYQVKPTAGKPVHIIKQCDMNYTPI